MDLEKIKYDSSYVAFTYHICWTKENLHYYGVRYSEGCHPTDIWTIYFTSSNPVKELRITLGEPDIIETRRTFKTIEKSWEWENRVLHRLNVVYNDKWINQCMFPCSDSTGRKHSEDTKRKMSQKRKGRFKGEDNPFYGKKHTRETIKKISEGNKGKIISIKTRKKISESTKGEKHYNYGKKRSKETKEKISESRKGRCVGKDNPNFGKHLSEETKRKLSDALKGEKHPQYGKRGKETPRFGKKHSEETKCKISESNKGKKHTEKTKKKMSNLSKREKEIKVGDLYNT